MASTTLSCDTYKLEVINSSVSSYQKNGTQNLGAFARDNTYVSEILCNPLNLTSIPNGSTITSAQIQYTVTANNIVPTTGGSIVIFNEDKSSWTDTGSAPIYSTFAAAAWATTEISDSKTWNSSTTTGTFTMDQSSTFNSLVSGWVNGTSNKYGFIMSLNCNYFSSLISITTVSLIINYNIVSSNINNLFMYYKRRRVF